VAVLLERSIELALAELAILKCGAAYLPLDQDAPAERQAFMIKDCQAKLVLTVKDLEVLESAGVKRVDIDELRLEERSAHNLAIPLESEMPAYVIYTSGSTGQPKGVVVPHRAVGRLALNNGYAAFEASDRVAFTSNPAFDASTMEVWAPLLHGGCLVVIPQAELLEPNSLEALLRRQVVDILHLVAGLLGAYAEPLAPIFPRLRYLLTGGDVVDPRAIAKVLCQNPPQRLIHCYGPSESTTFATTHEVSEVAEGAKSIPIGLPIANTQIYLLDHDIDIVPVGVPGELYIGGKGVACGYLGQSELTAERFTPNPFNREPGARLYRTGDLARRLPDGKIEFLGRIDRQVKIRGFRIELGEIEAHLSSHPAVRQCVVLARQGEGEERRLEAFAVREGEIAPSDNEMRSYLRERLPAYMLPAWFVWLEQMPLTPNGKINRKALAALESKRAEEEVGYVAPRTAVEEIMAEIFEKVLTRDRVGIHEDFFEIGGHSLLATQVISRASNTFKVRLGIKSIFEASTVAKLAEALREQEPQPGQVDKIALILTKLSRMTEADASAELAAMEQMVN
jgi:amino acid adenylation domain-containing protein